MSGGRAQPPSNVVAGPAGGGILDGALAPALHQPVWDDPVAAAVAECVWKDLAEPDRRPSPWSGGSGGASFCDPRLNPDQALAVCRSWVEAHRNTTEEEKR